MMTKMILTLILSITILNCLYSQNIQNEKPYYKIDTITGSKSRQYQLPLIINDEHPDIANKINESIQISIVGFRYEGSGDSLFSEMMDDDGMQGTISLNFKTELNSKYILSFSFESETYAAYPDYHEFFLSFNLITGDLINLSDLFTVNGIDHIDDILTEYKNGHIEKDFYDDLERMDTLDVNGIKAISERIFELINVILQIEYRIFISIMVALQF